MYVRDRYLVARIGNEDHAPLPVDRNEYDLIIGTLAYLNKIFDVKVEVSTVHDEEDGQTDVFATYTVRVY